MPVRLKILIGLLVLISLLFGAEAHLLPGYRVKWEVAAIVLLFTAYLLPMATRLSIWLGLASIVYLIGISCFQIHQVMDRWETLPSRASEIRPLDWIRLLLPSLYFVFGLLAHMLLWHPATRLYFRNQRQAERAKMTIDPPAADLHLLG